MFWPIVIFLLILLVNGIVSGGAFFEMKIVEGHLYGRIIDILRNGSKLMLLATGMTLVLATGGTDISVGSVMAISGAIACSIVANGGNVAVAVLVAILAGVGRGMEWDAGREGQNSAHCRNHDPDGGRPRYCTAHHQR